MPHAQRGNNEADRSGAENSRRMGRSHTALLLHDMQNDFCTLDGKIYNATKHPDKISAVIRELTTRDGELSVYIRRVFEENFGAPHPRELLKLGTEIGQYKRPTARPAHCTGHGRGAAPRAASDLQAQLPQQAVAVGYAVLQDFLELCEDRPCPCGISPVPFQPRDDPPLLDNLPIRMRDVLLRVL